MFDIYLITPEKPATEIVACVRAAFRARMQSKVALQLRAKHCSTREFWTLGCQLRELTRDAGALLFINDRVDLALACQADGVHLPENSFPVAAVRALLPPQMQVGVSCHDLAGLQRAERAAADFATLAPVFDVPGKNPPLGVEAFASLVSATRMPVYALGGLDEKRIPRVLDAGAAGVALIREVFDASDPAAALAKCVLAATRSANAH